MPSGDTSRFHGSTRAGQGTETHDVHGGSKGSSRTVRGVPANYHM